MIGALAGWLAGRTRRERVLLWLFALVAAAGLGWFAAVEPARARRAAAEAAAAEVRALETWLALRAAEAAALPASAGRASASSAPAAPGAPVGLAGIEARLVEAGLRAAADYIGNTPGGGIALRFEAVEFVALMAWLEAVEAEAGYRLRALRLLRGGAPGEVQAEIELAPAG